MKQQSSNEPLFASGPLSVSTSMLRFRGRRYKLAHIENTILKRPLFIIGALISIAIVSFTLSNADILYNHEIALAYALAVIIPIGLFPLPMKYRWSRGSWRSPVSARSQRCHSIVLSTLRAVLRNLQMWPPILA